SDGTDWVPMWHALKDRPLFQDMVVITCQYVSNDSEGIYEEGWLPRNAFTLLHEMALERWPIDPGRVVIGGFSAGAGNAFDFVMERPRTFPRVLVMEGGSSSLLEKPDLVKEAKVAGLRVAVVCGDVPGLFKLVTDHLVELLKEAGIEHRQLTFPQEKLH